MMMPKIMACEPVPGPTTRLRLYQRSGTMLPLDAFTKTCFRSFGPWRKAASDRLTTRTFDYAARVKPKLSSMTVVGPIGNGSARAVLSFTKLILSFQTFLRKSSKTWIVNCSPGQRR
jgi:hypothetical protein